MKVYVDQNFLINCTNQPSLHSAATEAAKTEKVNFILSPWHFYEVGTIKEVWRREQLLEVVDNLRPSWVLERYDLQLAEFKQGWAQFWGEPYTRLVPIGSLAHAAAPLLRTNPERLRGGSLASYIEVFSRLGTKNIDPVLVSHRQIAAENQISYKEGKITRAIKDRIARRYVAQQLASLRTKFSSHMENRLQLDNFLRQPLMVEKIDFFAAWGGLQDLRAYLIESTLTDYHHSGKASLNINRQVDRQHAVPALAYCDCFVTDDKELQKICAVVKQQVRFRIAEAITSEALSKLL